MRKILFFDTETNGLPIDYKASYTEVDNWPRVIQLGWILTDENGDVLSSKNLLIKPNGWQIPTEPFWIDNGFSQERSEAEGIPIEEALELFYQDKLQADTLVAHNLNFDHRIVWAEFIRAGREPRSGMNKICTMTKTTGLCRIPAKNGRGFKWPQLKELYSFLFGNDFEGAHDAGADIAATKDCFFELLKRGVVTLTPPEGSGSLVK
jgi:DNA polymerase III subunit epsilon